MNKQHMNLMTIATLFSQPIVIDAEILGVCTDTRLLKEGHLFIALKGEHFDGHCFLDQAIEKGAIAVVVDHAVSGLQVPQFIVPDTLEALAQIATMHRQTMSCPVIALTGSNGKTTVKEMIAAILPAPSLATKGNLNNHIGAPLSVLQLKPEHRYAVFELGANHAGEISHTVGIVRPDITLINNIGPAHIEGFGSIDGVAHAKGEIHQGLSSMGTAVINDDDEYAHFWDTLLAGKKTLRFSAHHPAEVCAQNVRLDSQGCGHFLLKLPNGQVDIALQIPGEHNIKNALAAAACCYAAGISIEAIQTGLNHFTGVKGRMMVLAGMHDSTVIDDTYNANLRSTLTALEVLAKRPGLKLFIFGDMGELGDLAHEHHQQVGVVARDLGIDRVMTCGTLSELTSKAFGKGGQHCSSQDDLVSFVRNMINSETTVLVKGSRSSAMEKIVQKLLI